jgi:hypothetical protein
MNNYMRIASCDMHLPFEVLSPKRYATGIRRDRESRKNRFLCPT